MKYNHRSQPSGSARQQAVAISLALVVFSLLCFIVLQAGAKYFFKQWLLDNGADSVTIDTLWFNPFSGIFTLNGVEITTAGNTVYSDNVLTINFGVPALFEKDALLEKAILRDMNIEIRNYPQGGMRVGSYFLSPGGDNQDQGTSFFPPWTFKVEEASFTNIAIEYQGDITTTLVIDEARAKNLDSGSKGETGSFSFSGKLNQAPVSFELTRFYLEEAVTASGKISLTGLDLDAFQALVPAGVSLEGSASVDGTFSLEETADGAMVQLFEGSIDLGTLTAAGDAWSAGGDLSWRGEIRSDHSQGIGLNGSLTAHSPFFKEQGSATVIESGELTAEGKATVAGAGARPFTGELAITLVDPEYSTGESRGNAESITWQGTLEFDNNADTAPARFSVDGQAEAAQLALSFSEETGWQQSSISLGGTVELEYGNQSAETTGILYSGSASLSDGKLTLNGGVYHAAKVEQEGSIAYRSGVDAKHIGFDSTLFGEAIGGDLFEENLDWLLNEAVIQGDGTFFIGGEHFFSGNGSIDITSAEILENGNPAITLRSFSIGQLEGTENGTVSAPKAAVNSLRFLPSSFLPTKLSTDSLLLSGLNSDNFSDLEIDRAETQSLVFGPIKQTPYSITADSLLAKGIATSSFDQYTLNHLKVSEAALHQEQDSEAVGGAREIVIDDMQAGADTLAAESITVDTIHYRNSNTQAERGLTITLDSLESSRAAWASETNTRIKKLSGSGLDISYIATKNSETNTEEHKDGERDAGDNRSLSLPVIIDSLELVGDNHILYKDPTLPETFEAHIDILSLEFADINLSDADQRFTFTAEARVDKHSPLTLSGSAALLASPRVWEHELHLNGYPLTNLTPFLLNPIGKRLTGGKLELVSEMTLEGDQVDMENTLELKEVEMKTASKKRFRQFNAKLPIPFETALSFLRDGEDTITLQIPIGGTLSSLDASYADIIVTALSNGISSAVKPMLAYTVLGPGGVLAYLGMKLGKDIISSDLPELTFEAGSTRLTPEHTRQLDSIGKKLKNALEDMQKPLYYVYPKVKPGELAGSDDAALLSRNQRHKLYRLGEQRAENVRQYLTDNFAIEKKQLKLFQPGILYDKEAQPTVTFME